MAPFFTWAFLNLGVVVMTYWFYAVWAATQQTYKAWKRGGRHHQRPEGEGVWVTGVAVAVLNLLLFMAGFFTGGA